MYDEIIAIVLIVLIIGGALIYIINAKKKGQKCIGCPYAKTCSKNNKSNSSCCDHN